MRDFIFLHKVEFAVMILLCSVIINILFRIRHIVKLVDTIIDDTLKVWDPIGKKRRFSGTKLTMLTAFMSVVWAFHYVTIKYGFNFEAFIVMACIATGVSVLKAYSKKLDPEVTGPDTQSTIQSKETGNASEMIVKQETIKDDTQTN